MAWAGRVMQERQLANQRRIMLLTTLTPDECHERLWPRYRPYLTGSVLQSFSFARGERAIALARGRREAPVFGSAGVRHFWFGRRGPWVIHGMLEPADHGTCIVVWFGPMPPHALIAGFPKALLGFVLLSVTAGFALASGQAIARALAALGPAWVIPLVLGAGFALAAHWLHWRPVASAELTADDEAFLLRFVSETLQVRPAAPTDAGQVEPRHR